MGCAVVVDEKEIEVECEERKEGLFLKDVERIDGLKIFGFGDREFIEKVKWKRVDGGVLIEWDEIEKIL